MMGTESDTSSKSRKAMKSNTGATADNIVAG